MGLVDKIRAKPRAAAFAIAVLVILVIVLAVTVGTYRKRWKDSAKGKFLTPGIGNREIYGLNPLWWYGSADAGGPFGSMGRATTPQQASVFMPWLRRSVQKRALLKKARAKRAALERRENFTVPPGSASIVVGPSSCATPRSWDLPAVAEAGSLRVLGAISP